MCKYLKSRLISRKRLKELWVLKFPSAEYYRAWEESVLPYLDTRAQLALFSKLLWQAIFAFTGQNSLNKSRAYIAEGGQHNKEFHADYLPFIRGLVIWVLVL